MTADERAEVLAARAECVAWLSDVDWGALGLSEADERLEVYAREVSGCPDEHCTWELLALRRFVGMVRRYGLNVPQVRRFVLFYESLYFPGVSGVRRYRLTPVQVFQFASIYGFWSGGRRVVREGVLFVPRKFSKTTSTAAVAVYDLLYGDVNGEAYVGANSQDQAKKCFDVIRGCVRRLDPHGRRYVVNEQVIKSRRRDRTSLAQCLTANARTKDGLNASVVIMDEFSQARDNNLMSVLTTSMGVRRNPLVMIITTASDVFDGPFYARLQGYKKLLLGRAEDESVFAHLFEPDPDDAEDDPLTWRKVQPHMGVTVLPDFYAREYQSAQRNGADAMLAFRTKLLNVYADSSRDCWISGTQIRELARPVRLSDFVGRPEGVCAFDLSVRGDFSAVTTAVYHRGRRQFVYHTKYFFPRGALRGHVNEALYRAWAEAGWLTLLDGDVIDYGAIADYVNAVNAHVRLVAIGYDAYKAKEAVNRLASVGAAGVLRAVRQTYGVFTAACETFEYNVMKGHAVVDDNPITAYCFGNAVLDYDRLENCKPVKRREGARIDGVITILMCQRLFLDAEY